MVSIIIRLIFILLVIFFHEVGHWVFYKMFDSKTRFKFEGLDPVFDTKTKLNPNQKFFVYFGGIFFGLVVLAFYSVFFEPSLFETLSWIGAYIIGCLWDIEGIEKIWRKRK